MQELQELMPDEETFRRVWRRVMPDEKNSPIVVHPPGPKQRPQTQNQPRQRTEAPEQPEEDQELLRRMLEMLDDGVGSAAVIVHRQPGAWPLQDSLRKSAVQARSAWFLMTGRRWEGRPRPADRNMRQGWLLREQYIREVEFSRLCRDGAQHSRGEAVREISPGLEAASRRRREMIRNLLTRT